jgi:HTH-type transcriptional regulator / antitoxin HigA
MTAEVRPIRSRADHEAALAEVERVWGAKAGTPEGDRRDVLATLINAYETEHVPIDPPDPVEAVRFRMEQQGLTRKVPEGMIGTRPRIARLPRYAARRGFKSAISLSSQPSLVSHASTAILSLLNLR